MSKTLTITQEAELRRCEDVIESGLKTFVEVGRALKHVRDKKLYRDTHGTFAAYIKERWGMSRDWADKTIRSAGAVDRIESADNCMEKLTVASQARALSGAPEEKQADVWREVNEECEATGEKVTAKKVEEAVARIGDDGLDRGFPEHTVKTKKPGAPKISTKDRTALQKTFADLCRKLQNLGLYESLLDELDAIQGAIKA